MKIVNCYCMGIMGGGIGGGGRLAPLFCDCGTTDGSKPCGTACGVACEYGVAGKPSGIAPTSVRGSGRAGS